MARRAASMAPGVASLVGYGLYTAAVIAVFATASTLTPAAAGVGTHVALGFPPCPLLDATGLPCPACGMTTAFAHVARGHVINAFVAQPFGALLAVGSLAGLVGLPLAAARGARVESILGVPYIDRLALGLLALFVLAWVYKITVMLLLTPAR